VRPLVYGSLFSGCGGLDLGLERAGLACAFQVEIDPHARAILERHWPGLRRHDDIRTFPPGDPADWACDLLVGGDPCQENSRARVTRGTRAPSLGAELLRVVGVLRPRLVLRENPTRARSDAPWPWYRFRDELERLGYRVLPFRLRACCAGAQHQRDRLFLLAESADPVGLPVRLSGPREAAGAAGGLSGADPERERLRPDPGPVGGAAGRRADARAGRADARLPSRVDRLRALGNAVDVRVAEWVGRTLLACLEADDA
jgi:DNA (cytosine-5)-methyltransferase 1